MIELASEIDLRRFRRKYVCFLQKKTPNGPGEVTIALSVSRGVPGCVGLCLCRTVRRGVSLEEVLYPAHTHRTLRDVKNAVDAFANYRPCTGSRQGNFRRRTMCVLTDSECYVPRVAP